MKNTDYLIIKGLLFNLNKFDSIKEDYTGAYPLDSEVRSSLEKTSSSLESGDDYAIFDYEDVITALWKQLIEKSIICLRHFDSREPFLRNDNKVPQAYGIDNLVQYFKQYREFESSLYGSVKYYRDHVIHVIRVWLLGMDLLIRNDCSYLKSMSIDKSENYNYYEKISVWTLIALTHDLGYPLEKSIEIFDKTRSMMKAFLSNPQVSMDLSFSGVQDSMNDFVLRFMSSRMKESENNKVGESQYIARLQPKYYYKFQKSLEHNKHGLISALIVYKMLVYFLESDFSTQEDYLFNKEEVHQFYIRREILRAIASHTCKDVYQMSMESFSFLLILCDEAQEWGRKTVAQLYNERKSEYSFDGIKIGSEDESNRRCVIEESFEIDDARLCETILKHFEHQCQDYQLWFRDGQDTEKRNFSFERLLTLKVKSDISLQYSIRLIISGGIRQLAS